MNPVTLIALSSLLVSIVTTIAMLIGQRRSVTAAYVSQLETRISSLEKILDEANTRIKDLEVHNGDLMRENIELLRQIARNGRA